MRVCDLTTLYIDGGEGGVNTYLEEKARHLSEQPGTSHVIIVPGRETSQRRLYNSTIHTIRSPRLPWNPQHRVLRRLGKVRRILKEVAPSVVEVDCAYFLGRTAHRALKKDNVPILGFYHVHLPTFIARPGAARLGPAVAGMAERFAWRYVRYCHRHLDRLIVSSVDMQERLRQAGFDRLDYAPLGVNLDLFQPRVNGTSERGSATKILYVGRLSHEKNLPVLLNAFKLLRSKGEFSLQIVGDGPLRGELMKQAGADSGVQFLGSQPYGESLAARYAAADIFACPSPNESFNLSILEALASGLPVVAARQGGPVNLVSSTELGELAEPGCATDLAEKIATVAARRTAYGLCRQHAEHQYSWTSSFRRLLDIYEHAIQARSQVVQEDPVETGTEPADGDPCVIPETAYASRS